MRLSTVLLLRIVGYSIYVYNRPTFWFVIIFFSICRLISRLPVLVRGDIMLFWKCNRTGQAIGSSGRQWDPLVGISGGETEVLHTVLVFKLKQNPAGIVVHNHLLEQFVWYTQSWTFSTLTTTLILRHRDSSYHDSIYRISRAIHHCRNKSIRIHFNAVTIHTQLYLSLPSVIYEFRARYLVFASALIDQFPQTNSGIPGSLTLSNFELKF